MRLCEELCTFRLVHIGHILIVKRLNDCNEELAYFRNVSLFLHAYV